MTTNSGIAHTGPGNPVRMNRYVSQLLRDIEQTDPSVGTDPRFLMAKAAADGLLPPMTHAEVADFRALRAAEMARAEQRRIPQPQLELGHV
jgi:hypothetical protein